MSIPIGVKTAFSHSDSLNAHIERKVAGALRSHAERIRRVDLRLSDANGPRGGADDKVARIAITLIPSGRVVATATAEDPYVSVNRAALRARNAVDRYVSRWKQPARRPDRRGKTER